MARVTVRPPRRRHEWQVYRAGQLVETVPTRAEAEALAQRVAEPVDQIEIQDPRHGSWSTLVSL